MRDGAPANTPVIISELESGSQLSPGGIVLRFKADSALNIGDAVQYTSAGQVDKSTTAGNFKKRIGIVVGGTATFGNVCLESTHVGQAAAAADEEVLVMTHGICYAVSDAAVADGGVLIHGSTTAGRVDDSATPTNGEVLGLALGAAVGAAETIKVLVNPA